MSQTRTQSPADTVAAWATGVGVGLTVLMVAWLVVNRIASLVWEAPVAPTVAIIAAVVSGAVATLIAGKRLVASVARSSSRTPTN